MAIPLPHLLILAALLFAVGVMGVLLKRNLIVMFLCVELMLNAANLTFIAFARELGQLDGQVVVFFVMVLAAAEAAVGLALIIAMHRTRKTVDIDQLNRMKY